MKNYINKNVRLGSKRKWKGYKSFLFGFFGECNLLRDREREEEEKIEQIDVKMINEKRKLNWAAAAAAGVTVTYAHLVIFEQM